MYYSKSDVYFTYRDKEVAMGSGKKILIVDDEASIRQMIAVALEMSGFNCFEADNATLALQMIIDNKPDM
jgi:two-component system phosphate regulon response regulator PhoB